MERVIVHSDLNHCYAQIEEMKHPHLRNVPMVVAGSEKKRSGIILAKNDKAREYNIKTAEPIRAALEKCPNLVIIHPTFSDYTYYTNKVKDIYRKYSDYVESFGLDEAWIDLTTSQSLFGDGVKLAKHIQDEVYERYGLTVSMGVSFNKIFAKLGSDLDKCKGFVVIDQENYKEIVWPRPVEELLMVGSKTKEKLNKMNIHTIQDLATSPIEVLQKRFGKVGAMIWAYANGLAGERVQHVDTYIPPKSVGNSKTVVRDIQNHKELKEVFRVLSESVSTRLKALPKCGLVINISMRDVDLHTLQRQHKVSTPLIHANDILECACNLAKKNYTFKKPLRSVGITVSSLQDIEPYEQLNLFSPISSSNKTGAIESVMETIRQQYGYNSIQLCSKLLYQDMTDFNPKETPDVLPGSMFK